MDPRGQLFRAPTVTLAELEMHVTTLNPGQTSHAPHQHANEELIILKEGTLETLSLGEWKRVGPGSVIFNASNDLHGVRNVGTGPAIYHVVNWKTAGDAEISAGCASSDQRSDPDRVSPANPALAAVALAKAAILDRRRPLWL